MVAVYPAFDLFYLFVEVVFGGVFAAGIGIAAIIFLIGMLGRESFITNIMITLIFIMTFSIGYVGGFATLVLGTLALFYFFRGLINFIGSVV